MEEPSPQKNPPWQRDELILALDLFFRHHPTTISRRHPEVVALSELLNALPIHPHRPDAARFRNPSGVYRKLCNFLRFDPTYKGKGLTHGNRLEEVVWKTFADDRERLRKVAEAIRLAYRKPELAAAAEGEEGEDEFPEGKVLYRLHRTHERNRKLVERVKALALERQGKLICDVCRFDFAEWYGEIGEGFIECHHTRPLSALTKERKSRVSEVALVCSNCHRMIHRKRPWLTMEKIASLLKKPRG